MLSTVDQKTLTAIVGKESLLLSYPDRIAYNADSWPRNLILSRGQIISPYLPAAILQPHNEKELIKIVKWATKTKTPLVPFGAGSGVCGGTLTKDKGIVVDMKHFNRILSIDKQSFHLHSETGIIGMNLERELNRQDLTLGHFPSSLYCSTLGGYLAGRSAGQFSTRFGKIEDMTHSIRVVTGKGEAFTTGKNNFDMLQAILGSEGTLGFITEAIMRIEPKSSDTKHRYYRGFEFDNISSAIEAMQHLIQSGLRPTVLRLYDEFDSLIAKRKAGRSKSSLSNKLIEKFENILPTEAASHIRDNATSISQAILGRVLGAPIILNTIVDALPAECLLIVGFEGEGDIVKAEAKEAFHLLGKRGIDLGEAPGQHWLDHRMDVSFKQSAMYVAGTFVDTMEVSTTWTNLERLYRNVRRSLSKDVFIMAHFSHAYEHGCSIYFTFVGYADGLENTLQEYKEVWKKALTTVQESGASIAHHHGVGISKAGFIEHDHPHGRAFFELLKTGFDPAGILNPGKVWSNSSGVEAWPDWKMTSKIQAETR